MNILIIDDDQDDIFLFCEALRELFPNAACVTAGNENELAKIGTLSVTFDVIFIDMNMSPHSAQEIFVELKEALDISKSKVVMYSGVLNPSEVEKLKVMGADTFLAKGTNFQEMRNNIGGLLKERYGLSE